MSTIFYMQRLFSAESAAGHPKLSRFSSRYVFMIRITAITKVSTSDSGMEYRTPSRPKKRGSSNAKVDSERLQCEFRVIGAFICCTENTDQLLRKHLYDEECNGTDNGF